MTPLDALREIVARAEAAHAAGQHTLAVPPELLALAKQAVQPEGSYPADLAGVPIFLDAQGLLTIDAVSLY